MIHAGISLLPANATPWETALSLASAERDVDAEAIRRAFDPWACPASILPWLAHTLSVSYWRDEWSENKKRRVISRAIELHFIKGTEEGVRQFIELADARLLKVTVPPQRVFSGASLSRADREDWLSRLPQIRVGVARIGGQRGFGLFCGARSFNSFREGRFPLPSSAPTRLGRRAVYVRDGVEVDARVSTVESGFRVHIKGAIGSKVFIGRAVGGFFQPSSAAERIIAIEPNTGLPWRSAVSPRLEPIATKPDLVVVSTPRGKRVFVDTPVRGSFFVPHVSRSFERYAIYDASVRARVRNPVQFMGVGRYGFPAHVAHLQVSVPGKRSPFAADAGINPPGSRFWVPHDPSRVQEVRRAITAAARKSDRLMLDFAPLPRLLAGQTFRAGIDSFVIGRPAA
jgi:phage tail-like protein